jgi:hypothetical protein
MTTAERLLKLVLIGCGAACMLATAAVFMPRDWMAVAHRWLLLREFPDQPIAEYLARLTSGLYALYGLLVLLMATDVRRYSRLITAQAVATLVLSVASGALGLAGGMPLWWIAGDIATASLYAIAVLVLQLAVAAGDRRKA